MRKFICWLENVHFYSVHQNYVTIVIYTPEHKIFVPYLGLILAANLYIARMLQPFHYPENAGYPVGGTDGYSPQYYMLEAHYDNPEKKNSKLSSVNVTLVSLKH